MQNLALNDVLANGGLKMFECLLNCGRPTELQELNLHLGNPITDRAQLFLIEHMGQQEMQELNLHLGNPVTDRAELFLIKHMGLI